MSAKLHIGTESFDVPEETDITDYTKRLVDAFAENTATTIEVLRQGTRLLLIINPSLIPYIALDAAGTGMGFHSG